MKKLTYLVMAMALLLGFTQCKKEQPQNPEDGKVFISVRVNNVASKVDINTATGHITFNEGDDLLVCNNGNCIGELNYSNGAFTGDISTDDTSTDDYLHFYFLGGLEYNALSPTQLSVVITDQTSSYPVISYGTSTEKYHGEAAYETTLENKCSLVKFSVDTPSDMPINIIGMKNKVVVEMAYLQKTTLRIQIIILIDEKIVRAVRRFFHQMCGHMVRWNEDRIHNRSILAVQLEKAVAVASSERP